MVNDTLSNALKELLERNSVFGYVTEYVFAPPRRWRFDYAWPAFKVAVEVEGGIWVQGSHTRGLRYSSDAIKYNRAALDDWVVLRYTTNHIRNEQETIIAQLVEALTMRTHKTKVKKARPVKLVCNNPDCGHRCEVPQDGVAQLESGEVKCWKCDGGVLKREERC